MILKLHPLAENDLKIALEYYYKISPTLEKKFLAQVDRHFNTILNTPNLYQYETKTSQKAVMEKFPYIIMYEQYEDIIMVLALFHTKQNPKKLTQRHEEI